MSIHKTYAVLGLGRYGRAVARELSESGAEVLAVDRNEANVNALAPYVSLCRCADVTTPEAVRQLGLTNVDVVIVSMASSLEASVLTVTLCREAGVKHIIAKCGSETHRRILQRVGAHRVVFPEHESGVRLAKGLLSAGFQEIMELSRDVSMAALDVPDAWVGKSLIQLDLRRRYAINVAALRRGDQVTVTLDPNAPLEAGTQLVVIAETDALKKL